MNADPDPNRPLTGLTVLVTRPRHQAESLAKPLRDRGAEILIEPMLDIVPPTDWGDVDRAIEGISAGRYTTLVFVSVNGVRFFLDRVAETRAAADFANLQVVCIGEATAEVLSNRGVTAQTVPGKSDSTAVAKFLLEPQPSGPILIVRANRGSDVIPVELAKAGAAFEQVVAYRSVDRDSVSQECRQAMSDGKIDWVTVTSSAIAKSLVRQFGDALHQTKLLAISPTTASALQGCGFTPDAVADQYNMQGIVDAIVGAQRLPRIDANA